VQEECYGVGIYGVGFGLAQGLALAAFAHLEWGEHVDRIWEGLEVAEQELGVWSRCFQTHDPVLGWEALPCFQEGLPAVLVHGEGENSFLGYAELIGDEECSGEGILGHIDADETSHDTPPWVES